MRDYMNIKWLFFDVGTTLVDEEKAYDHRVLDIIKDTNISFEEFDNCVYFLIVNKCIYNE